MSAQPVFPWQRTDRAPTGRWVLCFWAVQHAYAEAKYTHGRGWVLRSNGEQCDVPTCWVQTPHNWKRVPPVHMADDELREPRERPVSSHTGFVDD
jgi:hypothetical protein